jgi:glycosyltransferase involved in cell wall biosynthesis
VKVLLNLLAFRAGGGMADAQNFLKHVPSRAPADEFVAIVPAGYGYRMERSPSNCSLIETEPCLGTVRRVMFDNVQVPRIRGEIGATVLFSMGSMATLAPLHCNQVVMVRQPYFVHTVEELRSVGITLTLKERVMQRYFAAGLKSAQHIIAQTETVAERLRRLYAIECPVSVIPKTTSVFDDSVCSLRSRLADNVLGLTRLLYVTRYYPHKNIERACETAYELYKSGLAVQLNLTIEQSDGVGAADLLNRIEAGAFGSAVMNHGRVQQEDLPGLYERCDIVFAPSLLESFSANYIEAMRFGKPIVASDRDFARDVCKDAARYVDPLSVQAMVHTLRALIEAPAELQALVGRGRAVLVQQAVTWDAIADMYLEVLRSCAQSTGRGGR